jgi:hypothetical protein
VKSSSFGQKHSEVLPAITMKTNRVLPLLCGGIAILTASLPLRAQTLFAPGGTVGVSVNGNIGIGTANPSFKLDVQGDLRATGYLVSNDRVDVSKASNEGGSVAIRNLNKTTGTQTSSWVLWNMTGGYGDGLSFWRYNADGSNPGPSVWFGDNGRIGVGTMSPVQKIEINDGGIGFSGPGLNPNDKKLFSPADGVLEWQTHDAAGRHGFAVSHQGDTRVFLNTFGSTYFIGGNVGIGTSEPVTPLHVVGGAPMTAGWNKTSTLQGTYPVQIFNSNATKWAGIGYDFSSAFRIWVNATSDDVCGTGLSAFSILNDGNVGIGTSNPTQKLSVNGTIRAKEVIVETTGWSDYVFAKDYDLRPLSEVEQHINQDGHLPGIPSAAEVSEKGIGLGEMQARLLAKIEELTLHQIALEKRVNAQAVELDALKKENASLRRQ